VSHGRGRVRRYRFAYLTSGTTGKPKGVMLTHKNFCSNFKASIAEDLHDKDNFISILPLHHASRLCSRSSCLFPPGAVTYAGSLRTDELLALIREAEVTVLPGCAAFFYVLYADIGSDEESTVLARNHVRDDEILWQLKKLSG